MSNGYGYPPPYQPAPSQPGAYAPGPAQPGAYPPAPYGYPGHQGYPAPTGYPMRSSAPISVHLVAIAHYLAGVSVLVGALLIGLVTVVGSDIVDDSTLPADVRTTITGAGVVVAAIVGAFAVLILAIGRRLQRGRRWARVVVLGMSVLSIAGSLYGAVAEELRSSGVSGIVLPVLFIVLLSTRAARSWFQYHTY